VLQARNDDDADDDADDDDDNDDEADDSDVAADKKFKQRSKCSPRILWF